MNVLCAVPWRSAESDSLQKSRDTIGHHTMRTAKKLRAKAIRETWFVLGKLFRSDLKALVADHNRIQDFPEVLLKMPHVEQLSLGENYLRGIPLDIDMMAGLEILSLWGNVLARFPASLGNLERLQILDLLHNEMTVEEQDMLQALLPDVQLNLSEPCNCEFDAGFTTYPTE